MSALNYLSRVLPPLCLLPSRSVDNVWAMQIVWVDGQCMHGVRQIPHNCAYTHHFSGTGRTIGLVCLAVESNDLWPRELAFWFMLVTVLKVSIINCLKDIVTKWNSSFFAELYLSNIIRGSKFWLLKSTTVLMHRYIESRPPPLAFFNSSRGVRNFRGGFNPHPPTNTALLFRLLMHATAWRVVFFC